MPDQVHLHRWADMAPEQVTPMFDRRLITCERVMLANIHLKQGCLVPMHSHEHEQVTSILRGGLRFWIGSEEAESFVLKAGEVLHIPSNVPHKAQAVEDTDVLDVFSPPRQDWLDRTDDYLRR